MTASYSYFDAVQQLTDFVSGAVDQRAVKIIKRAVQDAYSWLPHQQKWRYYYRRGVVVCDAPYETGTVVYDHTGGTNERELTLTGGTWPANARFGWVVIDQRQYKVERRVSSTVVTLTESSNPGADVASTTYQWYRSSYTLPVDYRANDQMIDSKRLVYPSRITPGEVVEESMAYSTPSLPWGYAVQGDEDVPGRMAMVFFPPPDMEYRFDFIYQRRPPALNRYEYTTGTVATTINSTAVTGTGTSWTDDMVGSVFTVGTASQLPDGFEGQNPWVVRGIVLRVVSATSLVLSEVAQATTSGAKYRISDRVDVEDGAMWAAFKRRAEYEFAVSWPRDDVALRQRISMTALEQAREADRRNIGGPMGFPRPFDPGDMPVGADVV